MINFLQAPMFINFPQLNPELSIVDENLRQFFVD